jgi:Amidohydrolase family
MLALLLSVGVLLCAVLEANAHTVVLKGATIIDVDSYGNSTRDLPDAVIVITDGTIAAVGSRRTVDLPRGATVIDVTGKYLLPALCDSFIGVANQSIADAMLYMGVTTALGAPQGADNVYFEPARGPRVLKRMMITGYSAESAAPLRVDKSDLPLRDSDLIAQMDRYATSGVRVFHLAQSLQPRQTALILLHAKQLGVATVGELANTPYPDAIRAGISALLHSPRYALALADSQRQAAVAADPFGAARNAFYKWLEDIDANENAVRAYAQLLATSKVGLIPTLAMVAREDTAQRVPATEPVLKILVRNKNAVVNRREPPNPIGPLLSENLLRIEQVYAKAGVHYLTGGGTHYGQLPGRSIHAEMKMLVRIGLTPRQAIAAATSNFASIYGFKDVGSLKPGSRGDLIVLDADPLVEISNTSKIHSAYVGGTVVDRDALLENRDGR